MTKTRRAAGSRQHPVSFDASGGYEEGKSEIESLKEEIGEWRDNLEGNGMEHLPKFDEVSEAADALENIVDTLDGVEVPDCLDEAASMASFIDTRRSAQSRAGRMSNAIIALQAAADIARQWLDENEELEVVEEEEGEDCDGVEKITQKQVDERQEQREAVEEFADQIEEAIGEAESVCFPGMY